jgi:hypothetical protein
MGTDKKGTNATPKVTTPDFAKILETLSKSGGGTGSTGAVYTQAEADKDVQSIFQQSLGRNAAGNDYAKAMSIAMAAGDSTGSAGRQQAVLNWIQKQPEFLARQDNQYLDAIYKEIAASVANTKVR